MSTQQSEQLGWRPNNFNQASGWCKSAHGLTRLECELRAQGYPLVVPAKFATNIHKISQPATAVPSPDTPGSHTSSARATPGSADSAKGSLKHELQQLQSALYATKSEVEARKQQLASKLYASRSRSQSQCASLSSQESPQHKSLLATGTTWPDNDDECTQPDDLCMLQPQNQTSSQAPSPTRPEPCAASTSKFAGMTRAELEAQHHARGQRGSSLRSDSSLASDLSQQTLWLLAPDRRHTMSRTELEEQLAATRGSVASSSGSLTGELGQETPRGSSVRSVESRVASAQQQRANDAAAARRAVESREELEAEHRASTERDHARARPRMFAAAAGDAQRCRTLLAEEQPQRSIRKQLNHRGSSATSNESTPAKASPLSTARVYSSPATYIMHVRTPRSRRRNERSPQSSSLC